MTDEKIARMLAAFEAELPEHELGRWFIERQPDATTIVNEDMPRTMLIRKDGTGWRIIGYCYCTRCGKRFEIPRIGNFHWSFEWEQEREDKIISNAKGRVERIAALDGKCWGDVPELPRESMVRAVQDTATAPVASQEGV